MSIFRGCATSASALEVELAQIGLKERKAFAKFGSTEEVKAPVDSLVVVSVAWHIIYENQTLEGGFLSEEQVAEALNAVNEHYNGTGIAFSLSSMDSTENASWYTKSDPVYRSVQNEMKETLHVGNASTLNIYSVGFGIRSNRGLLGYATYPWQYENNTVDDGVVVLYSTLPGGSEPYFNEGKTLTHEIGHWLGLYHPFQGGCTEPGDFVDDTPSQVKTTTGCPEYQDSCPGEGMDNFHNFMDYAWDSCMFEFTPGQAARAREQIFYFRNLTSSPGG